MEIETLSKITEPQKMGITGYLRSFIAHRLSYYLKLKGPSYIADTACSSSLNALEHAFKAIRSGQCDNAIVGGVNLLLHPGITLQFFRLGVLSYDGICKVFDQNANGYVRGDTIACIFLQKSKVAKRIYAQLLYTKINCDGYKSFGITFPSTQMQQQLLTEIFDESGYSPSDLSYLEAHGTGTEVGDPQEVEAIDGAIAKKREKPLLIGSVKCSIGHTEPASGLCSLIKVIIAMETGLIAPNIYLKKIKAGMEGFEQGRLKAVTELTELEGDEAVVGINNFGFGGNNCHLLIKRFKKEKMKEGLPNDDVPRLVCVSGRTEESILSSLNDLKNKPFDTEYVRLFHNIFKKNHKNFLYRGYTILSKNGPLKTSFKFYVDQPKPLYVCFGQFDTSFRLLGNHFLHYPPFKATISRINTLLSHKNINIIDIILDKQTDTENALLGALAVQIGIVDVLKTLELNPAAVHGDGLGKLITAYYYETITLEEAMLAAYKAAETVETVTSFAKIMSTEKNDYICDISAYKSVNFPKNSIILNISDKCLNANEIMLVENNTVTFLEFLGRIYEQGHDLHLHKIYPEVQFPVSRGTPMISPLIKWNYKRTWYTYKFEGFMITDAEHREFNFSMQYDEHKFMQGHIIDGRNLFPATAYLNMVWETYVQSRRLAIIDVPIVFESCRFIRAVTMPKRGYCNLYVSIQRGTGIFEIMEKDALVVTGRIYSPEDVEAHKSNFALSNLDEHDPSLVLEQDEIYRELYLRGYNYSGLFKGLAKCNVDATTGLIKWEGNWITFMDKMLQMRILQMDTRSLYVPTGIQKIVIDPWELLNLVGDSSECLISVNVSVDFNIVKTLGIEIWGIQANSISRRINRFEPVLEKYEFIPNETLLDLMKSIRINTQIILENSLENNFNAVEIPHSTDSTLLLPLIQKVLEDVPLTNPNLTISTKTTIENIPGVKVEHFPLVSGGNLLLIIGTKILQRSNLKPILIALSHNGFVLTRENLDFAVKDYKDIEIVTQHVTEEEKLILFRESKYFNNKFIEVSSNHFEWLPELQNSLKQESNVVVYSQNRELDGIIGLVNCMRREPGGSKVKCFFIVDDAPKFDPLNSFYQDQIKKCLAVNVYKNGKWGTYRHLLLEELKEVE
ncbi:Ketoacyl-synt C, ketoacyl-synt, and/or PS-DH domain containing protein, partial [Asbolus verrucosus]